MKNNADRYVTVIYCDDIRQEVGNKLSFIGCYQGGELHVQVVPSALPKLCAFVSVVTPKERPFKSLSIRVLQDETELALLELPTGGLSNVPPNIDDSATRLALSTAMMFAPFMIEKPTSLRILVTTEEGEMIGPRLAIKVQAAPEAPAQVAMQVKPAAKRPAKGKVSPRRSTTTH
jgi:hypothetical protein